MITELAPADAGEAGHSRDVLRCISFPTLSSSTSSPLESCLAVLSSDIMLSSDARPSSGVTLSSGGLELSLEATIAEAGALAKQTIVSVTNVSDAQNLLAVSGIIYGSRT